MHHLTLSLGISFLSAVGSAGLCVILYFLRWKLWPSNSRPESIEKANWGAFRVGTLHALIVSLTFSSLIGQYEQTLQTLEQEALAIENLDRFVGVVNSPDAERISETLAEYASVTTQQEWPLLRNGETLPAADMIVTNLRLTLSAEMPNAADGDYALSELGRVEEARNHRKLLMSTPLFLHFWLIAVFGFIFTLLAFFVYPPSRLSYGIIAGFGAINGMIFLAILSLSNPFIPPMGIQPTVLEDVAAKLNSPG